MFTPNATSFKKTDMFSHHIKTSNIDVSFVIEIQNEDDKLTISIKIFPQQCEINQVKSFSNLFKISEIQESHTKNCKDYNEEIRNPNQISNQTKPKVKEFLEEYFKELLSALSKKVKNMKGIEDFLIQFGFIPIQNEINENELSYYDLAKKSNNKYASLVYFKKVCSNGDKDEIIRFLSDSELEFITTDPEILSNHYVAVNSLFLFSFYFC